MADNALTRRSGLANAFFWPEDVLSPQDEMRQQVLAREGVDLNEPWYVRTGQRLRRDWPQILSGALSTLGPRGAGWYGPPARPSERFIIANTAPRSNEGLSLSRNLDSGRGSDFSYFVFRDGRHVGEMMGRTHGRSANTHWVQTREPMSLGDWRRLREDFRSDFPRVNTFVGERVSGAQANSNTLQTVRMPAMLPPLGFAADQDILGPLR